MSLPPELQNAASRPVALTVRKLLGLFGERSRDFEVVGRIESILTGAGLACEPPLRQGQLDSPVTVGPTGGVPEPEAAEEETGGEDMPTPAAIRVADVPSARLGDQLVSLKPGHDLDYARWLMSHNRFSQLPVLSGATVLKGVVSWKSIALAHARGKCTTLADATETAEVVRVGDDLLTVLPALQDYGCVFVRDEDEKICGLVTAADMSLAFGALTGPYLRLGEIERRLRRCVERMCPTVEQLRTASGNNKADGPEHLMLGQIQQVFKKPDRWAKLGWSIHHDYFYEELDAVRKIRNEVAHFRPSPLTREQLERLEKFAGMLRDFQP
ncbi:CBS domain-containing protein [Actinomadura miaoliensis]|uniref:CBS domain-containing protein n=1 Tax=Actinomadura miaoliensis TaxID=430685 RepID=A0ABP7W521_9ACTN